MEAPTLSKDVCMICIEYVFSQPAKLLIVGNNDSIVPADVPSAVNSRFSVAKARVHERPLQGSEE